MSSSPRQEIDDPARQAPVQVVGLPAGELPDLDRAWSRVVAAPDVDGVARRWHLLDNGPLLAARGEEVVATLLCVHGNPTWSYLWRRVLAQAPPGWRVVAVDQLGMGWSERLGHPLTLADRVETLDRLTAELGITGPVATLAHDWGGPVSLGWAVRRPEQLLGVVLTNTAVHQPQDALPPTAIRLARAPGLLDLVCRRTPAFVRATTALSIPPLPGAVRDAFASPYATPARRHTVADFVRDIPFEEDHPSRPTLDGIATGLRRLADVPALLVWGPRDPVFSQRYLEDLLGRLPHADVQRYADASHLVLEDRPEGVALIWDWLRQRRVHEPGRGPDRDVPRVPVRVDAAHPDELAVVEMGTDRRITFAALAERVEEVAAGLAARGVRRGDRVAVLVPPGIELTTLVYALWRLGAVVVVADAGLGLGRLGAALRGAGPRFVLGLPRALALAAATRVPGRKMRVGTTGAELDALAALGRAAEGWHPAAGPRPHGAADDADDSQGGEGLGAPDSTDPDADGAVLFTSGATGPPKGVVYTRAQLGAQVALLRDTFHLAPGDRLVAAFAPFALYGPALGLTSVVPDMEVTAPHTLTASALADAVAAVRATAVFAAPAALRNVVATADALTPQQREALAGPRLVLSAGAPVPVDLLRRVRALLPGAETQTPYGMTEALPVATLDPTTLEPRTDAGVCVGSPVPGVTVRVSPLDGPAEVLTEEPGVVGEIVVRGAHVKERYDRLWGVQDATARPAGWHRTGDVGHLDEQSRLWVEGRAAHVVRTEAGPVTPYAVEDRVRTVPGVSDAAVVGVGPAGTQQVVVVVVPEGRLPHARGGVARGAELAPERVADAVREVAGVPVAAVLARDWLPVDVRHASKVDRGALAAWADGMLHGRPVRRRLRGSTALAPSTRSR